jgi:hypothetical protein
MTNEQFRGQFRELRGNYPGFAIPDLQMVMAIYFASLKTFDLATFKTACHRAVAASPNYFAPLGLLKNLCESVATAREEEDKYPRAKFWPHDHGCGLENKRLSFGTARGMLFVAYPYEGIHVLCRTTKLPRCPHCGVDVSEYVNPFIESLMRIYPEETRGWNPLHKGNLLCVNCEALPYPQGFMKGNEIVKYGEQ